MKKINMLLPPIVAVFLLLSLFTGTSFAAKKAPKPTATPAPVATVERDYDWWYGQKDTGRLEGANCDYACITMAAKWADEDFDMTVEEVRKTYPTGGPDYPTAKGSVRILTDMGLRAELVTEYLTIETAKEIFENGNIILIKIKPDSIPGGAKENYFENLPDGGMRYVYRSETREERRINRWQTTREFTPGRSGTYLHHAVILCGYEVVNGVECFTVQDPGNYGYAGIDYYDDGTPRGMYRPHECTEIIESAMETTNDIPGADYIIIYNPLNKTE